MQKLISQPIASVFQKSPGLQYNAVPFVELVKSATTRAELADAVLRFREYNTSGQEVAAVTGRDIEQGADIQRVVDFDMDKDLQEWASGAKAPKYNPFRAAPSAALSTTALPSGLNAMQFSESYKKPLNLKVRGGGIVIFIETFIKQCAQLGIQPSKKVYDLLLDVFPKRVFQVSNLLDALWSVRTPQIECALFVLQRMEEQGVTPDVETYKVLYLAFGRAGPPTKKAESLHYWFTRARKADDVPRDRRVVAELAAKRFAGDQGQVFSIGESADFMFAAVPGSARPSFSQRVLERPEIVPHFYHGVFSPYICFGSALAVFYRHETGADKTEAAAAGLRRQGLVGTL